MKLQQSGFMQPQANGAARCKAPLMTRVGACQPPRPPPGMVPPGPGPQHSVPPLGYSRLLAFHICLLFLHLVKFLVLCHHFAEQGKMFKFPHESEVCPSGEGGEQMEGFDAQSTLLPLASAF